MPAETQTLGDYIRNLRKLRGMSQRELARLCGLSSAFICRLEQNSYADISSNTILLISDALNIKTEELYFVAANISEPRYPYLRNSRPRNTRNRRKHLTPVSIPIAYDISAGWKKVDEFAYWSTRKLGKRKIKGLVVKGFSLEPLIIENDIIFVEFNLNPKIGDIVLCYDGKNVWLEKYTNSTKYLYGVVAEVNKAFK